MRRQPKVCPVHLYERLLCDTRCAAARYELVKLGRDYRQYWYDRARGVQAMSATQFRHRYNKQQRLWQVWGAA